MKRKHDHVHVSTPMWWGWGRVGGAAWGFGVVWGFVTLRHCVVYDLVIYVIKCNKMTQH